MISMTLLGRCGNQERVEKRLMGEHENQMSDCETRLRCSGEWWHMDAAYKGRQKLDWMLAGREEGWCV